MVMTPMTFDDFADTINVCSQCGAFLDGSRLAMEQQKCMYEFNPKAVKSKCELHKFDALDLDYVAAERARKIGKGRVIRNEFKQAAE